MKKAASGIVASLVLLGFAFAAHAIAAQKPSTFSGEISDRYCAKAGSHESMMKTHDVKTIDECIPACVKAGGKYVLVGAADGTVYALDDQQKPAAFARQKVKITGALDQATQTIHVENIEREK
jgi:flagellin-like protein